MPAWSGSAELDAHWQALTRKQQKAIVRFLDVKTPAVLERKLADAVRRLGAAAGPESAD